MTEKLFTGTLNKNKKKNKKKHTKNIMGVDILGMDIPAPTRWNKLNSYIMSEWYIKAFNYFINFKL